MRPLILLALGLLLSTLPVAVADPIIGRATVTDGDTIEIRDHKIRLFGIVAPEGQQSCKDGNGSDHRCGRRAAFAL